MSTRNETGHAINVANLLKYNEIITAMGATYNPALQSITLASLTALQTTAKTKLEAVKTAYEIWKAETNNREILFKNLDTFATRLLGSLKSTIAPQQTIDDMAALVGKIRGTGKSTKTGDAPATATEGNTSVPITRSNSQRGFDQRIEHFSKIIILLQGVASYTPNETELQVVALQAQLTSMQTANAKVAAAYASLLTARIDRNTLFYTPDTGMLDLIKKSKAYIVGLYGKTSPQYQSLVALKFVKVVRKA